MKQKERTDNLNCPSNSKAPPYARYPYDNLRNLNDFTFPPRMITDDTAFELVLSWLYNPQIKTEMINEEDVFKILECYRRRYPGAFDN